MKRVAVLTSGGDAPGMNTALRAVVKAAARAGVVVMGVENGFQGLMEGRMRPLAVREVDEVGHLGGTILGSARARRFREPEGRAEAAWRLRRAGIDGLLVVGGNGSLTGAHLLAAESSDLRVVGVPASIDNDIGCTATAIGVDTALNTIVEACDRISDTARAHRRAFVVEVMGRQCGYLAMASAVAAGADAVLYREQGRSEEELVALVRDVIAQGFSREVNKRRVLVIKAEGVAIPCTRLVRMLQDGLPPDVEVRATVLGHLVRGGNPSFLDRMVAGRLAYHAFQALLQGASDEMVAWQPNTSGGTPTGDPHVQRFPLWRVLEETDRLLDGSSEVTRRRVRLLEEVAEVLRL